MNDTSQQFNEPIIEPSRSLPSFSKEKLENENDSRVALQEKQHNVIKLISDLDDDDDADMTEENSRFYNSNQAIIYPLLQCNDSIAICPPNDAQSRVCTTNYIYENESEEICRCGPNSIFFGCSCERLYPKNDWTFHNSTNRLSRNMSEAVVYLTRCTQSISTTDLTQPTVLSLPRDVNQELKMSRTKRYSKRRKVNVNDVLKQLDTRDSSPESIDTRTRRKTTRKPPKKKLRSNKSRKNSLREEAEQLVQLPTHSSTKRACFSNFMDTNDSKNVWNQSGEESRNFNINQSDERHDDNPSSTTNFQSSIDLTPMDSNYSKIVCLKSAHHISNQTDATCNINSQPTTIYVNTTNAEKVTQSLSRMPRDLSLIHRSDPKVDYHESINLSGIQSDSTCTNNLPSTSMNAGIAILSKSSSPPPIVLIPMGVRDSNNVFDKSANLASQLDATSNKNLLSSTMNEGITIPTKSSSSSPIVLIPTDASDSNKVCYKSASQSDKNTSSQLHNVSNLTVAVSDSRPVFPKESTNNVSGLHDENQSLSITEASSTSSFQTHSIVADSNEFEDYCSCRNCCRSKRCVCVRATKSCNPSCICKDCDNPLNILEAYDVNIEVALKDDCLRSIMNKVKHLELFLDRSVRIGCCQGEVRLLDCIPGKKSCPHCDAQIQYSWCRGVVCVESLYPRKHCVVCNKCSIVERDIYCSCISKPKISITNSSRENKN